MQTKRYKWMNSGSSQCRKYSVDVLGALFGYISLSQWKLKINKRLLIRSYCLTETAHAFVEPAYPQWKEGGKHLCLVGVNHGVLTDTVEDFTQIKEVWPGQQAASCYTIKRRPISESSLIWLHQENGTTIFSLCVLQYIKPSRIASSKLWSRMSPP